MCFCGKHLFCPLLKKIPNCPRCKNNTHVIKWGETKNKIWYIQYKQQRYFCKIHKISFSKILNNFDEKKLLKAYLGRGDEALKEYVFDESETLTEIFCDL